MHLTDSDYDLKTPSTWEASIPINKQDHCFNDLSKNDQQMLDIPIKLLTRQDNTLDLAVQQHLEWLSEQQLVDQHGQLSNGCAHGQRTKPCARRPDTVIAQPSYTMAPQRAHRLSPRAWMVADPHGQTSCRPQGSLHITKIIQESVTGYKDVSTDNKQTLMSTVAQHPVSIDIETDQSSFQSHSSGVLTASCVTQLDHGARVVGYGSDADIDYWNVRNSRCGRMLERKACVRGRAYTPVFICTVVPCFQCVIQTWSFFHLTRGGSRLSWKRDHVIDRRETGKFCTRFPTGRVQGSMLRAFNIWIHVICSFRFQWFPRPRFLGLLPATHVDVGIVALDHRLDKDGKTESRHGVLL